MKETIKQTFQRFIAKVMPEPNTGCWFWMGGTSAHGYGRFSINDITVSSHRFSFEYFKGSIPYKLMVLHSCDNPYCVNPDHLFIGTHQDNMDDKIKKDRCARQKGERHGRSKLTENMTFDEWIKSLEGQTCNDEWTLNKSKGKLQPYLKNRLWYAFQAGVKSKEATQKLNNHIKDLHDFIKRLKKENRRLLKQQKRL